MLNFALVATNAQVEKIYELLFEFNRCTSQLIHSNSANAELFQPTLISNMSTADISAANPPSNSGRVVFQ